MPPGQMVIDNVIGDLQNARHQEYKHEKENIEDKWLFPEDMARGVDLHGSLSLERQARGSKQLKQHKSPLDHPIRASSGETRKVALTACSLLLRADAH